MKQEIFPHLIIFNTLNTPNGQCLYESVAISNGIVAPGVDTLFINIDIGDGTTDMSAMMIDKFSTKHMCGYSSVEYAGKNLIKNTIKDIMQNAPRVTVEKLLKGGAGFGTGIFASNPGISKSDYDGLADNLINNFFKVTDRKNDPDSSWENSVLDILNISSISSNIDPKIAMNFMLRYIVLMPVVKDFTITAIKLAGENFQAGTSSINISFYGGASKGIEAFTAVDPRTVGNVRNNIDQYFADELKSYSFGVTVNVPQIDGKQTLITGLHSLKIVPHPGFIQLLPIGSVAAINWSNINPTNYVTFGEPDCVHCNVGKFQFASLKSVNDDVAKAGAINKAQLKNPQSYYDDLSNPVEDFKNYFNNEIFGKILDNKDGHPDLIETIIKDFINNASPNMQNCIRQKLLGGTPGNSFIKATSSNVYPEMMKNTIFMFAVSDILTEFHGPLRSDHIIMNAADIPGYQFGG